MWPDNETERDFLNSSGVARRAGPGARLRIASDIRSALGRRSRPPGRSGDSLASGNGRDCLQGDGLRRRLSTGPVLQQDHWRNALPQSRGHARPHSGLDRRLAWLSVVAHRRGCQSRRRSCRHLALQEGEARLYCNLIRSYITFLIAEHERLSRTNDRHAVRRVEDFGETAVSGARGALPARD